MQAVAAEATGLLHLTNSGPLTWFDLAVEVATMAGLDASRIAPCTTAEFPTAATRPANSVLRSERLAPFGLTPIPHYRAGLERVVAQIMAG